MTTVQELESCYAVKKENSKTNEQKDASCLLVLSLLWRNANLNE